ncbi:RNA polymerase sigma factor [Herbiconiux sp. UC225_62]|uniref:RNA polymerase sigma factor n=1 Tax=Herbiconiux sp. UC225_62 TaxID=3350168 RepID=UPI0036D2459A
MDSGDETDAALWSRGLEGDGEAVAVIFDRHERRLFRAALRDAPSTHDAEDIVATVFLELWRLRAKVRLVDDSLLPWLLVTTANVSRNASRSRRRHHNLLAKMPPDQAVPDSGEEALDNIVALQRERRISAALQGLRPADRQILILTAVEGLSLTESSAVLGIGYDAAKARLVRARHRARKLLTSDAIGRRDEIEFEETPA